MANRRTPRGPDYTEEERERILTALALRGGSAAKARELLKGDETLSRLPTREVIRRMGIRYAARYGEILAERAPQIEQDIVRDYRSLVARALEVQMAGIERTAEGMAELSAADASKATRDLAITGAVGTDKLLLLDGRPTEIHVNRSPEELLSAIEAIIGRRGEDPRHQTHPALEIPDADVIEET